MNATGFYNAAGIEITSHAFHALKAVALLPTIGRWAAMRYATKYSTTRLYRIARQLQAANKFDNLKRNNVILSLHYNDVIL